MSFETDPALKPESSFSRFCQTWLNLHVLVPMVLIGGFTLLIYFELVQPEVKAYTAFWGAPSGVVDRDPVKKPAEALSFPFKGRYGLYTTKHQYVIEPIYSYELEARVLHVRHYWSDENSADLIPFDIAFGWKAMSDLKVLTSYFLFYHGNSWGRYLRVEPRVDWQDTPPEYIDEAQSGKHYSNNHIIPMNEKAYEVLKQMKSGQLVKLKGYLVDVTSPDKPDWSIKTSRYSREASNKNGWGDGASSEHLTTCDTMLVMEAEILKK